MMSPDVVMQGELGKQLDFKRAPTPARSLLVAQALQAKRRSRLNLVSASQHPIITSN